MKVLLLLLLVLGQTLETLCPSYVYVCIFKYKFIWTGFQGTGYQKVM